MPENCAGWVLPIENPLGTSCLKRVTKGQKRRRWRHKIRQARRQQQSRHMAHEYLNQSYLLTTAHTCLLTAFFWRFAPSFLPVALLPLLLLLFQSLSILYPTWQGLPEWKLFEYIALNSCNALILLVLILLTGEIIIHLSSYTHDSQTLLVAASQVALTDETSQLEPANQKSSPRRRMCKLEKKEQSRKASKRICIPIDKEQYDSIIENTSEFRKLVDCYIEQFPELFPKDIKYGYKLHGMLPTSKKMPEVVLRRIKLTKKDNDDKAQVFTIAPSFVMPYMTGYSDEIEKALFLHNKFGVAYWALTYPPRGGEAHCFWS